MATVVPFVAVSTRVSLHGVLVIQTFVLLGALWEAFGGRRAEPSRLAEGSPSCDGPYEPVEQDRTEAREGDCMSREENCVHDEQGCASLAIHRVALAEDCERPAIHCFFARRHCYIALLLGVPQQLNQ